MRLRDLGWHGWLLVDLVVIGVASYLFGHAMLALLEYLAGHGI